MAKSKLEYIWLDGYQPTQTLRSKTKIEEDLPRAVTAAAVIASQRFYAEVMGLLNQIRQDLRPLVPQAQFVVYGEAPKDWLDVLRANVGKHTKELSSVHTQLINTVREELTGEWGRHGPSETSATPG